MPQAFWAPIKNLLLPLFAAGGFLLWLSSKHASMVFDIFEFPIYTLGFYKRIAYLCDSFLIHKRTNSNAAGRPVV